MFELVYYLAFAAPQQGQQGQQQGNPWGNMFLMLGMIFIVFYFLILRPQNRQQKEHRKKMEGLQKGDKIVTIGGICGMVENIKKEKNIVVVKVADNVKVEFTKNAIANVIKPEDEVKESVKHTK